MDLHEFGFRRLVGVRRSPQPFIASYVEYEQGFKYTAPLMFGSFEQYLLDQVYGASGTGSVRDYFDRLLGVTLAPVGGAFKVWHLPKISKDEASETIAGLKQLKPGAEVRGIVRQRLVDALATAGINVTGLDADRDGVIESPGRLELKLVNQQHPHLPPEVLVLSIDNLGSRGGQTGSAQPDSTTEEPGLTWSGSISGIAVDAGAVSFVHELLHQLGATDLYGAERARNFERTIMAAVPSDEMCRVRLDPWHEMQFGTVEPLLCDLDHPDSVTIEHAGSDEFQRKAVLLTDDAHPYEGFLVQLRVGPLDPLDLDCPAGWYVWHVAVEPGDGDSFVVPSWYVLGGLDASINVLGAPDLGRGETMPWTSEQVTPELRWLDGAEIGRTLRFDTDPGGTSGRVSWQPFAGSWLAGEPLLSTSTLPGRTATAVSVTLAGGQPVVGSVQEGRAVVETVLDGATSPWEVPSEWSNCRGIAVAQGPEDLLIAVCRGNGTLAVAYPPYFDAPVTLGAINVEGSPAATWFGKTPVIAWSSQTELWVSAYNPPLRRWDQMPIEFDTDAESITAGTRPALAATGGFVYLAWTGRDGQLRMRRAAKALAWHDTVLNNGVRTPRERCYSLGWGAASPALVVGPDRAVWVAAMRGTQSVTIARALAAYGPDEGQVGGWRPLRRTLPVSGGTELAVAGDQSGIWIATTPIDGPVRLSYAVVPTKAG